MFCIKCQIAMYEMEDGSYYCLNCGHVQYDRDETEPQDLDDNSIDEEKA